ncbi:MAG TPA: hypothetical protein VNM24_11350 [Burkholderiales bacterium]|nr:hypothetical protein [Burkholderiales bacterium]
MDARRSFSIDVKVGESVTIDRGRVVVTLLEKSGRMAKLGFNAAKEVPINKVTPYPSGAAQARKGIATA